MSLTDHGSGGFTEADPLGPAVPVRVGPSTILDSAQLVAEGWDAVVVQGELEVNHHLATLPDAHGLDEGQDDLALDAEGQPLEAVVELPAEGRQQL